MKLNSKAFYKLIDLNRKEMLTYFREIFLYIKLVLAHIKNNSNDTIEDYLNKLPTICFKTNEAIDIEFQDFEDYIDFSNTSYVKNVSDLPFIYDFSLVLVRYKGMNNQGKYEFQFSNTTKSFYFDANKMKYINVNDLVLLLGGYYLTFSKSAINKIYFTPCKIVKVDEDSSLVQNFRALINNDLYSTYDTNDIGINLYFNKVIDDSTYTHRTIGFSKQFDKDTKNTLSDMICKHSSIKDVLDFLSKSKIKMYKYDFLNYKIIEEVSYDNKSNNYVI